MPAPLLAAKLLSIGAKLGGTAAAAGGTAAGTAAAAPVAGAGLVPVPAGVGGTAAAGAGGTGTAATAGKGAKLQEGIKKFSDKAKSSKGKQKISEAVHGTGENSGMAENSMKRAAAADASAAGHISSFNRLSKANAGRLFGKLMGE